MAHFRRATTGNCTKGVARSSSAYHFNLALIGWAGGGALGTAGGLERRQTNKSAAAHTPNNPPTCGHFAAAARSFRGARLDECPAMAEADHKAAIRSRR